MALEHSAFGSADEHVRLPVEVIEDRERGAELVVVLRARAEAVRDCVRSAGDEVHEALVADPADAFDTAVATRRADEQIGYAVAVEIATAAQARAEVELVALAVHVEQSHVRS